MIQCTDCNTMNVDNTLFCGECGNYLSDDDQPKTDPFNARIKTSIGFSTNNLAVPLLDDDDQPASIRLSIGNGQRELEASLDKAVYLGRIDPVLDNFPEVDLTEVGGLEKGVSRRHAKITRQQASLIVEDLGSINGTYINGQKLAPYSAEVIHDGDQLRLGRLTIELRIS